MPRIGLVIEYNGSLFHGWQRQPGLPTVQDSLLTALRVALREQIKEVVSSGRTDTGVHAEGQVVSFKTSLSPDLWRLAQAISGILRNKVAVLHASVLPDTFHPRKSARGKVYRYLIINRATPLVLMAPRAWHVREPLDIDKLRRASQDLIGTHDFSSFQGGGCESPSPIKTIYGIDVQKIGDNITISIHGSGFLKHMVRILVGTLVDFTRNNIDVPQVKNILERRKRTQDGITAPANGLTLERVYYTAEIESLLYAPLRSPAPR